MSNYIANPTGSVAEFQQLLSDIAQVIGINERQLAIKIEHLRESATKLLTSYGASSLIKHIKPLPKASDFENNTGRVLKANPHKDSDMLNAFMQLNALLKSTTDFTNFIKSF